jgi:hypothetical protein
MRPPGRRPLGRYWLAGCALAIGIAACAEPALPLLSPIELARRYGYSETPTGDARYRISYIGPYRRGIRSESNTAPAVDALRNQAIDFAMWRAAQIAGENGYRGFTASNVHTDLDTFVDDYYDPFYRPWYAPGSAFGPPPWGTSWVGSYWGPSPYKYERAQATIDVQLRYDPDPGDYDAHDVVDQLRRRYPDAEGAVNWHTMRDQRAPVAGLSPPKG